MGAVSPSKRVQAAMWSDGTGRVHLHGGVSREAPLDDLLSFNTHSERWSYE